MSFPAEFSDDCDHCGQTVHGRDVACHVNWSTASRYPAEPGLRTTVWCLDCHEDLLCQCT